MGILATGVIGYLLLIVAGDALLAVIAPGDPAMALGERVALGYAVGAGVVSLLLFAGSLARPGSAGVAWVAVPVVGLLCLRRRPSAWKSWLRGLPARLGGFRSAARSLDLWSALAALVLGAEMLANVAATFLTGLDWDALAIWELKARIVFLAGGLPLSYLSDASRLWSHLDYPWLLPFTESLFFFLAGQSNVLLAKMALPGFYASLLLLVYFGLRRTQPRWLCLTAAALIGATPILTVWAATGFADSIVALYWTGSVLYLYSWLTKGERRDLILAVLLVCLATWTKNEGLIDWALQGGMLLCAPLLGRKASEVVQGWCIFALVSAVIVTPWILVKRLYHVPQNDFLPVTLQSALEHRDRLPAIAAQVVHELLNTAHWGILWPIFFGSLLLVPLARQRGARLYIVASIAGPMAILALSYVYSRWEPFSEQMLTSLDRLVVQEAPTAVLFAALQVGDLCAGLAGQLVVARKPARAAAFAGIVAAAVVVVVVRSALAPAAAVATSTAPGVRTPLPTSDCSAGAHEIAQDGFDPYAILAARRPDVLAAYVNAGWDLAGCDTIFDTWVQQSPDGLAPSTVGAYVRQHGWAPRSPQPTPTAPDGCRGPSALDAQLGYDPYAILAVNRPDVLRYYVANGWNANNQCVAIFNDWLRHPDGQAASTAAAFVVAHGWSPAR